MAQSVARVVGSDWINRRGCGVMGNHPRTDSGCARRRAAGACVVAVVALAIGASVAGAWQPVPLPLPAGTTLIFGETPQAFVFVWLVTSPDGKVDVAVRTLPRGPLPPPGPDPPIPPPTPDPLTGLAKMAYDWAVAVTPDAKRKEYGTALSVSFSGMAAKIAAGAVSKPQEIIDQTTAANRAAVGEAGRAAWLPWFEKLRVYLNSESKAGRLVTPEHYTVAWREIAKGLEAVR